MSEENDNLQGEEILTVEEGQPEKKDTHWPSAAQFGCGIFVVLLAFGGASVLIISAIFQWIKPITRDVALQSFALAMGGVLVGMLVLPSVVFSFPRVFKTQLRLPEWMGKFWQALHPRRTIYLVPAALGLGLLVSQGSVGLRLLLPPLHVFMITTMAVWLVWLGIRGLPIGSGQRMWGVVSSGLVLGPMILIVLEILAAAVGIVWVVFRMSADPALSDALLRLSYYFEQWVNNPEIDLELLGEALNRPEFLIGGLIFLAVVIPLLEELIKPIGVWLLLGRKLSEREGFVIGVISGAAYGLFENITSIAPDETWAGIVTARLGTSVMHIITTGVVGWGLASAWKNRRFLQFFGAYLLSVTIHGLWNGVVIVTAFSTFQVKSSIVPPHVIMTGPLFLVLLTVGGFILLVKANHRLRDQSDADPEMIEETATS